MINTSLSYKYRTKHDAVPLVNVPDKEGLMPLHVTCSRNNKEFVKLLLKAGANPTARYY